VAGVNPKLRSYLQAGARLTGCRSSMIVTGQHDLNTPDGERYVSTPDGGVRRQGTRYDWTLIEGLTFEQLLWRWQPDLSGSASSQHYIETGRYLAVHEILEVQA
jgi:hypothetical protein